MIKVQFGCGTNKLEGWTNHDAEVDIEKLPLPYPDASVDFILIEHCVEHIDYYAALRFFEDCRRILKPGGVFRVIVPSLEQIRNCDDPDYYPFTTKWQDLGPTKRGAMRAILFAHGHKTAWTRSLLDASLYYAGFEKICSCWPSCSSHPELRDVDGHARVIGARFNTIESLIMEGS